MLLVYSQSFQKCISFIHPFFDIMTFISVLHACIFVIKHSFLIVFFVFHSLTISTFTNSDNSTYLVSHDHRRPSINAQDGYECLRGNKIQNLGNGLLVSAVPEHHAVDLGTRHQVAHVGDDAFWVSFVDQQCDHIDVNRVLFAPKSPDVPVRDVACASQDHRDVQHRHFF